MSQMANFAFSSLLLIVIVSISRTCAFIHRTNYRFLINQPDLCSRHSNSTRLPYIIYCVHGTPDNFDQRVVFRQSVANKTTFDQLGVITAFFVGIPRNRTTLKRLITESRAFGDIVMPDVIDSFQNNTLKSLAALQFIQQHCQNVPYVLKANDDTFVDLFQVVDILQVAERVNNLTTEFNVLESSRATPTALANTFFGRAFHKNEPHRDRRSKYHISRKAFPLPFFPGK